MAVATAVVVAAAAAPCPRWRSRVDLAARAAGASRRSRSRMRRAAAAAAAAAARTMSRGPPTAWAAASSLYPTSTKEGYVYTRRLPLYYLLIWFPGQKSLFPDFVDIFFFTKSTLRSRTWKVRWEEAQKQSADPRFYVLRSLSVNMKTAGVSVRQPAPEICNHDCDSRVKMLVRKNAPLWSGSTFSDFIFFLYCTFCIFCQRRKPPLGSYCQSELQFVSRDLGASCWCVLYHERQRALWSAVLGKEDLFQTKFGSGNVSFFQERCLNHIVDDLPAFLCEQSNCRHVPCTKCSHHLQLRGCHWQHQGETVSRFRIWSFCPGVCLLFFCGVWPSFQCVTETHKTNGIWPQPKVLLSLSTFLCVLWLKTEE